MSAAEIINPPPDLEPIINTTAQYVALKGIGLEKQIKIKQANNKRFDFLKPSSPFHAFYRLMIKKQKGDKDDDEGETEKTTDEEEKVATTEQSDDVEEKEITSRTDDNAELDESDEKVKESDENSKIPEAKTPKTIADELRELLRVSTTPKEEFIVPRRVDHHNVSVPININPIDLDIIKLTAQFVATNGRQFLAALSTREQRNPQFDFLKPLHPLFSFFEQLVASYRIIIQPPDGLVDLLRKRAKSQTLIYDQLLGRAEYERREKRRIEDARSHAEEERREMSLIDWHDFVVLETIEFTPTDNDFLQPPATTIEEINARFDAEKSLQANALAAEQDDDKHMEIGSDDELVEEDQEEEDEIEAQVQAEIEAETAIEIKAVEVDEEITKLKEPEKSVEKAGKSDEKASDQIPVPSKELPSEDKESVKEKEPEDEDMKPAASKKTTIEQTTTTTETVTAEVDMDVDMIVEDEQQEDEEEVEQLLDVPTLTTPEETSQVLEAEGDQIDQRKSTDYQKCTICGEHVHVNEIKEHMRIELLDPRWKEQKEAQASKQRESSLADSASMVKLLGRFAESRQKPETSEKDEKAQMVHDQVIWDGHKDSIQNVSSMMAANQAAVKAAAATERKKEIEKTTANALAKSTSSTSTSSSGIDSIISAAASHASRAAAAITKPPSTSISRLIVPPAVMRTPLAPAVPSFVAPVVSAAPSFLPTQPVAPMLQVLPTSTPTSKFPPAPSGAPPGQAAPPPEQRTSQPAPPSGPRPSKPIDAGRRSLIHPPPTPAGEPPQKKARSTTESAEVPAPPTSLVPEDQFMRSHLPQVDVGIQIPHDTSKPEWNFNGQIVRIRMQITNTISELKQRLKEFLGGMPPRKQKLRILGGAFVKDSNTLAFYNVTRDVRFEIGYKARGGRK